MSWEAALADARYEARQEGLQKGRQEGVQKGRQEGRQEGVDEWNQSLLEILNVEGEGALAEAVRVHAKALADREHRSDGAPDSSPWLEGSSS